LSAGINQLLDLAVVVVNWNVRDLLVECLASVFRALEAARLRGEVWVVDNASTDGSVEAVREQFASRGGDTPAPTAHGSGNALTHDLRLIASPINLWFGGGQNLAMRAMGFTDVSVPEDVEISGQAFRIGGVASVEGARLAALPRYVLVLNPDTLVREGALGEMVRFMDRIPDAGVCGPRLVYGDGRFQHAAYRFPTLAQCFLDFWPLHWRLVESRLNGRYARRLYDVGEPFPIDHPLGAAMLFRREVIEQTSGFDLTYRMYVEEIDWCMRVKRAGWAIYCVPSAEIVHFEGQSTRQVRPDMVVALWRSRYVLFGKYYSPLYRWVVRGLIRAGMRSKIRHVQGALRRGELGKATERQLTDAYRQVIALF
jgi:N-acetylglucosaminyl-diphospho-decaprenol L-rhamnosyltransferase